MIVKDYLSNNETSFKRVINNSNEIIFENGKTVSTKIDRKVQYIKPVSKSLYRTIGFITLDIETKNIHGILSPICISLYDGKILKSFFIDDFKSEKEMICGAFNTFKSRKYNYQRVYIYNLSYFDGVFLLKHLALLGDLKPLFRNGQIYNIRLELLGDNNQKHVIYIRDSYLLLPLSLAELGKSFDIKDRKTIFPIHSVNELPLNFIGPIPSKKYFLSESDYGQYILTQR